MAERALAALRTVEVRPGDVLECDRRSADYWPQVVTMEAVIADAQPGAEVLHIASGETWRSEGSGEAWVCAETGARRDESHIVNMLPVCVLAWPGLDGSGSGER